MLFMFRVCHGFLPCCHLLGKGWPLGSLVCDVFWGVFLTFPCGILGQVWYLIVMIPDLCLLTYFVYQCLDNVGMYQYAKYGKHIP